MANEEFFQCLFLSICSILKLKVTAQKSEQQYMVSGAVDDRYTGCRDKAFEKFIKGGLLNEELKLNADFSKVWSFPEACFKQNPKTSKDHLAALIALNSEDERSIISFNKAVQTLGEDAKMYEDQFHFKSLHFLLMDSMRELQPKDCKTVYALPEDRYVASKGSKMRLGRFLKAYFSFSYLKKLTDLNDNLILNITSCFFAKMGVDICSKEDAVLLAPTEVFTVEDLTKVNLEDEDTEYQVMTLKHAQLFSYHNCYIFSR